MPLRCGAPTYARCQAGARSPTCSRSRGGEASNWHSPSTTRSLVNQGAALRAVPALSPRTRARVGSPARIRRTRRPCPPSHGPWASSGRRLPLARRTRPRAHEAPSASARGPKESAPQPIEAPHEHDVRYRADRAAAMKLITPSCRCFAPDITSCVACTTRHPRRFEYSRSCRSCIGIVCWCKRQTRVRKAPREGGASPWPKPLL